VTQETDFGERVIPDYVSTRGRARLLNSSLCDGSDCPNPPVHHISGFFGIGKFCDQCASHLAALVVNAREHESPTPEGQAVLRKIGWKWPRKSNP
jgi:hypothetical protein